MPDITITCPECGREYRLSEYAKVEGISCLTCGAILRKPRYEQGTGGLKLKSLGSILPPPVPASGAAVMAAVAIATPVAEAPASHPVPHHDIHHEGEAHDSPKWLSVVIATLVLAAFAGFQYFAKDLAQYETAYFWARNLLAAGSYLLVVMLAFQDGLGPGALCVVIPPYSLFYASSSIESAWVRGIFFGTVLAMVTEVYFIPDTSLVMAGGQAFQQMVAWVDGLMVSASESPR